MQSLPEFFFVWESSNLVMSWHALCLPKWGRKHPFFFARHFRPPSPLNLQTVQPPHLVCLNLQTVQPPLLVCILPPS